jgi:hypothetical protein
MLRLNSLIANADTPDALEAALAAGAEFISGAAIAPAAKAPFSQRPASLDEVRASARTMERQVAVAGRRTGRQSRAGDDVEFI